MEHPFYDDISISQDKGIYEFVSKGKKEIQKIVVFSKLDEYYNLGLGDLLQDGEINFKTVSDNGDMPLIIATVVQIIIQYTNFFSENIVSIYGSNRIRTLLYERAIRNNFEELNMLFDIWGIREDRVKEMFNPSNSYLGFL